MGVSGILRGFNSANSIPVAPLTWDLGQFLQWNVSLCPKNGEDFYGFVVVGWIFAGGIWVDMGGLFVFGVEA